MKTAIFSMGANDYYRPVVVVKPVLNVMTRAVRAGLTPVFILPNPRNPKLQHVSTVIRELCARHGVRTITPLTFFSDGVHPTGAEYRAMASEFYPPDTVVVGDSIAMGIHQALHRSPRSTFVLCQCECMGGARAAQIARWNMWNTRWNMWNT